MADEVLDANTILQGPAQDQLKTLDSESIDLIVTDPPYGYSFMNKDWDKAVVGVDTWKECLRVLKPGAFAFIMSSPRQDVLCKMILNLIDAGFETNFTSLYWCYASGFPKAADVSKLIDKRNGKHRPVRSIELEEYLKSKIKERYSNHRELAKEMGIDESCIRRWTGKHLDFSVAAFIPPENKYEILKQKLGLDDRFDELIEREEAEREILEQRTKARSEGANFAMPTMGAQTKYIDIDYTKPATPQAKRLQGAYAGFQPKPAVELILTVMKPLSEKTFVDQALSNQKGITWLDDCRIPYQSEDDIGDPDRGKGYPVLPPEKGWNQNKMINNITIGDKGRFPANLLVEDDVLNEFKNPNIVGEKNPNYRGGFYKECIICKNDFWVRPSIAELRKTCSNECRHAYQSEWMRNENNPKWNGGHSSEYKREKTDRFWKQRRLEVYTRDRFQCQICGRKSDLHAHHVIPCG